ncbi:unnamed protein product [Rodentolepis nana]|uniref:Plexin_cytopl domain-containing protein n=1 Tax=Rodentolepis nana TaxID=102285 RepID=A0A0R3TBY2_RODNA|nr:unnamed protein product [Rodentolepis nana]
MLSRFRTSTSWLDRNLKTTDGRNLNVHGWLGILSKVLKAMITFTVNHTIIVFMAIVTRTPSSTQGGTEANLAIWHYLESLLKTERLDNSNMFVANIYMEIVAAAKDTSRPS